MEVIVKFCLLMCFKLYFSIKVHHRLQNSPKHILMQLRIFKLQPKKVREAVTFCVRIGPGSFTQKVSSCPWWKARVKMTAGSQ